MASYASVGDLILAKPGAMIGFAGARVIKRHHPGPNCPPAFQTAEFSSITASLTPLCRAGK